MMEKTTKPLWETTREAMGKTYEILLMPDDQTLNDEGSTYGGRVNHRKQQIPINAVLPCDGRDETLLHEIVHRVGFELSLDLGESQVNALSTGVFAYLCGFGLWKPFPWPECGERVVKDG